MRVRTKLALGYGLLIVLLAGLLVYHVAAIHTMVATNETLASLILRLSATSSDQLARLEELDEYGSKYWAVRDTGYVSRFEASRTEFGTSLDELEGLDLSAAERGRVDSLSALWPRLFPPGAPLDELVAAHPGSPANPTPTSFGPWLEEAVRQLRARTRAIYLASEREMEAEVAASVDAGNRVEGFSIVALAAALTLSVIVFGLVFRSITRPLADLRQGTHKVAGDFEYRLPKGRADEFSELAEDFNVMTERLRELEHAKRDFLSSMSHDLKTPLAAIQDANLLLLEEIPGALNPRQKRLLEHNATSGRRLASMLAKLLDVSRLEAGAVEYRFERCDLQDVVREAVTEFESMAERRGISLEADLDVRALPVECDSERVLQVVENLLENAFRYSPEGGVIRVEARSFSSGDERPASGNGDVAPGGFAFVGVEDAGPGVPDEEKAKIFERFHQSPGGRGRAGGGVGLGLSICREIVSAHGGRIWVTDSPSGGSLFSFLLPLAGPYAPLSASGGGAA